MPVATPYLFLGDLVDRGEFSVQTVILLFLLILLYPDKVFAIRGNHEFQAIAKEGGFLKQVEDEYDDSVVFDMFMETFAYMPLACLIDGNVLCLHGGIGPSVSTIADIRRIDRPIFGFENPMVADITWSDPNLENDGFTRSSRGTGSVFGNKEIVDFMNANQLVTLIRAHEWVVTGTRWDFDRKLVTVFSASNYCGTSSNQAAVLEIRGPGEYIEHFFPSLPYLFRSSVTFTPSALMPPVKPHGLQASKSMNKTKSHAALPELKPFSRTVTMQNPDEPASSRALPRTKSTRG
jgi:protein phosphatase